MTNSVTATAHRSPLRTAALAVVSCSSGRDHGFIPGLTTDYDQNGRAGHDFDGQLLGVFQVSVLHNIVHLLFGLAGIALARNDSLRAVT